MSQIRSFDDALDFFPEAKTSLRCRFGGAVKKAAIYWNALVDGHAAASHYEDLRRRGYAHDTAASKVFADHYR